MKGILEQIKSQKRISVRVKTSSGKTAIISFNDEILRVSLKAAPEKGKANIELVKFLSKKLGRKVIIVSGLTSKNKVVKFLE